VATISEIRARNKKPLISSTSGREEDVERSEGRRGEFIYKSGLGR